MVDEGKTMAGKRSMKFTVLISEINSCVRLPDSYPLKSFRTPLKL